MRVFVSFGCLLSSCLALAAPPVPEFFWDGDFNVTTKGEVKLILNGNATLDGGARVCIGSRTDNGGKGVTIDWSERPMSGVSVLVKYEGYVNPAANWGVLGVFRGVLDGALSDHPGVCLGADGGTMGVWIGGVYTDKNDQLGTFVAGDGSGYYLIRNCPGGSAVTVYQEQGGVWTRVYANTGLKASAEKAGTSANGILGYTLGGADVSSYDNLGLLTGLHILGVAVFSGELSAESAAEYKFPSEQGTGTVVLNAGADYVWSLLDWEGAPPTAMADSAVIRVNGDAVLEMDESSVVMEKCTVTGTGSLTLKGAGLLSGRTFVTDVPLKLQTATGDLTLASGMDATCSPAFGNGEIRAEGALPSPGLSGTGVLKVTDGALLLRGDEDFTGVVRVEENGMVVSTNGVVGRAGFSGDGCVCFQQLLPAASMEPFFKSEDWKGRVRLDRISGDCADINPDLYSNPSSKTVLAGVRGWVPKDVTFANEIELSKTAWDGTPVVALELSNGYGYGAQTVFSKMSGRGTLNDTHTSAATSQILRLVDVSDFHGTLSMRVKRAVIGATETPKAESGTILVPFGEHLDAYGAPDTDDCGSICAPNGIYVEGELTIAAPAFFVKNGVTSPVVVGNRGVLRFAMNATFNHGPYNDRSEPNYSNISGTGSIEFTDFGSGVLRSWSDNDERMWQRGLEVVNLQGSGVNAGIILTYRGTAAEPKVRTIDTLSGTGCFRSDANMSQDGSGALVSEENRSLRIVQGRDTTWSGVMGGEYDNVAEVRVAAAETAPGATLRMTGVNTLWRDRLVVESGGSVRLDGSWNGDIQVDGVLSGSGTNTNGRLSFSAGSVYDARKGLLVADEIGSWSPDARVRVANRSSNERIPIMEFSSLGQGVRGSEVTVQYDDGSTERLRLVVRGKTLAVGSGGLVLVFR